MILVDKPTETYIALINKFDPNNPTLFKILQLR